MMRGSGLYGLLDQAHRDELARAAAGTGVRARELRALRRRRRALRR